MPIFVVEFGKKHYLCRRKKGEMQEWLNWPAWKASKPQKGFGGSNPPLSAKRNEARRCRKIRHLLFFDTTHANSFVWRSSEKWIKLIYQLLA